MPVRRICAPTLATCAVAAALVLGTARTASGQESVSVALPASVEFSVGTTTSTTTGSPSPTTIQSSNAILVPLKVLRISVRADSPTFSGSNGASMPVSSVSWTVSGASGGTGSNGTLSASSYSQVFQTSTLPSSGAFNLAWTLGAVGNVAAGNHSVTLRWKIESVLP